MIIDIQHSHARIAAKRAFAARAIVLNVETTVDAERNAAQTPRNEQEEAQNEADREDDPRQSARDVLCAGNYVRLAVWAIHFNRERTECRTRNHHIRGGSGDRWRIGCRRWRIRP